MFFVLDYCTWNAISYRHDVPLSLIDFPHGQNIDISAVCESQSNFTVTSFDSACFSLFKFKVKSLKYLKAFYSVHYNLKLNWNTCSAMLHFWNKQLLKDQMLYDSLSYYQFPLQLNALLIAGFNRCVPTAVKKKCWSTQGNVIGKVCIWTQRWNML